MCIRASISSMITSTTGNPAITPDCRATIGRFPHGFHRHQRDGGPILPTIQDPPAPPRAPAAGTRLRQAHPTRADENRWAQYTLLWFQFIKPAMVSPGVNTRSVSQSKPGVQ